MNTTFFAASWALVSTSICHAQPCDPADLFGPAAHYPVAPSNITAVEADFNGDGRPDYAVALADVSISYNQGDATFGPVEAVYPLNASRIVAADLDSDGDVDLGAFARDSAVLLNDANGGFTRAGDLPVGSVFTVVAADIDADGDQDIVVGFGNGSISLLLNDGAAHFVAGDTYSVLQAPTSGLIAADLDADGDVDLAAAGTSKINIFLNDGAGAFEPGDTVTADGFSGIDAADLNADAVPDLVVANTNLDAVSVLLNSGNATFPFSAMLPVGADKPTTVRAADYDGDGDADIVTSGTSMNAISVLLNNANATFAPAVIFPNDSAAHKILPPADLDGDADLDLLIGATDGRFTVIRNILCEDVPTIGGFSGPRAADMSLRTGSLISTLRNAIATSFGPIRFVDTPTLTDDFLEGIDVLLISSIKGTDGGITPLSESERQALLGFVLGGGAALLLTEGQDFQQANASILTAFGMTSTGETSAAVTPVSHPIWDGPFGAVDSIPILIGGWFNDLGQADALGTIPGANVPVAVIEPDALDAGSGPVVLTADSSLFFDQFIEADAETFALNALAYIMQPACPADINDDGNVNILDFVTFQILWQQQDAKGDCDANNQFNILDFVCFQQIFAAGCD